ncbi:cilia- and flagella-associated protein 161-like isoform X2 [Phymastichus coffea]|uniref:cilia- and flagella-associated protein 161-like isoform X2 n=1 Tax=Phymastichus coffea TaxID=108790 RepID=UPI00273B7603|nr:cilia- and flagella-associated protein 161-like isoform X2 [Phymastichus coffea]
MISHYKTWSFYRSIFDTLINSIILLVHAPEVIDMTYKLESDRGCPDAEIPWGPRQLGLTLAATAAYEDIEIARMVDGCAVACSPYRCPASRNIFKIVDVDFGTEGDCLTFGRQFYLQLPYANEILYLRSETPLIDGQFGPKYHNPLRLNVTKDCYAKWRALYWNRQQRFETEGDPIPPCIRIVIQHVMTGQCLAVENLKWHRSILGYECGASAHTYADVHRNETSECIWNFIIPRNYN